MAKQVFKTEIKQLLNLMIHSLYSHKEIFLRELISNSSDALDKLNYLTLSNDAYKNLDFRPRIDISFDEAKNTLTIKDNGIGMDEAELNENLSTIAKSGTKSFLENLSGDKQKDSNLIGQFGVGFYSCFMVANKVVVTTKKALSEKGFTWISDGSGEYEVLESKVDDYGTSITLYLNDDSKEFSSKWGLQNIIKKYSNHISFPIFLHYSEEEVVPPKEGEEEKPEDKQEKKIVQKSEQVNTAKAIWTKNKSEVTDEAYAEFFKTLGFFGSEELAHTHSKVEGNLEYKSLFYLPSKAPADLRYANYKSHIKLYVKRVFITDNDKDLLPSYLRFVGGVIDSDDLPLNVSREILQQNKILANIKAASTKKILSMIESLEGEKKATFDKELGVVFKEGLLEDYENKERILDILSINSTKSEKPISFKEYKEGMIASQTSIFYMIGTNLDSMKHNPILEKFKDVNVLLFNDEVDKYVVPQIGTYKDVKLLDIFSEEALKEVAGNEVSEEESKTYEPSLKVFKDMDAFSQVRLTKNLSQPLALSQDSQAAAMAQLFMQMGQTPPPAKKVLDVNIDSPLIQKLNSLQDEAKKSKLANLLVANAQIMDGEALKNAKSYIESINELLLKD
ncbi:molecular chaperone HtpG [Helicobacter sp. 13S00401-1]|uniref:molecular chaperone HtpG n=1 Tax=Helicobacter sp. 13S00401-1 TaxID=1905758 RepID=UPI000BA61E97|nr:molecular chaperone HtpG [Helicobacter sp. 13S00401-1]PAF49279.1 molecular chaperone HtpG [Helicobacter sp. 13S00401-1]